MTTEKATAFWKSQTDYPFPFTRKRRIYELNYLVPRIVRAGGQSLLDLGCGDGSLLECLLRLTDVERLHGYDVAAELLKNVDQRIKTAIYDIKKPGPLPNVDMTVIGGVIQYIFDDEVLDALFTQIKSPIVWVRSTCTLKSEAERVVTGEYASNYRTVPETHALLSRHYYVSAIDRIYPDELESEFGTKQFYFEARRRN